MKRNIIGVTVGTPTSASRIAKDIEPVKTVNGQKPDKNGNVEVVGSGSFVTPQMYGAKGDGVTDDKAVFGLACKDFCIFAPQSSFTGDQENGFSVGLFEGDDFDFLLQSLGKAFGKKGGQVIQ